MILRAGLEGCLSSYSWMFDNFPQNNVHNSVLLCCPKFGTPLWHRIMIYSEVSIREKLLLFFQRWDGCKNNNSKDDLQRAYRQLCRLCSIYRGTDIQQIISTALTTMIIMQHHWRYKDFVFVLLMIQHYWRNKDFVFVLL